MATKVTQQKQQEEQSLFFPDGLSLDKWRFWIPNGITILALFVGLSAVNFGVEGHFDVAVIAVLVAGLLDALDGPAARALKGWLFPFHLHV